MIYSDSTYTIRWTGEYGSKCENKGWPAGQQTIPNLELGKTLYLLCNKHKNVKLNHIKAHTGLLDELSLGNEGADMMANLAIGRDTSHTISKSKYYLKIPYSEKIIGKKFGAKWDPKNKKWYYEGYETDSNFKTLMNLFPL